MVAGDQRRPVDRTEVRTDVDEHDVGHRPLRGHVRHPTESRYHAECPFLPVEALRPLARQLVLGGREAKVTRNQADIVGDLPQPWPHDVTDAPRQRRQRPVHGAGLDVVHLADLP